MKKIALISLLFIMSITLGFSQEAPSKKYKKIPSIEIKDLQGNVFNTADIKNDGKPIILDFWATTCKPCIKELMALDENYADWEDETGVKIYIVSTDGARSSNNVAPFVNGKGWEFVTLLDPNSDFKRAMGVIDIPHTFVIDGEGNIVHEHASYSEGDEDEYYKILMELTENK